MYDHVVQPASDDTVDVRSATSADHPAAVAFYQAATGSPEAFLTPYLTERIDLQELYLLEADGQIAATGECRVDQRAPANAHLGLVVGTELPRPRSRQPAHAHPHRDLPRPRRDATLFDRTHQRRRPDGHSTRGYKRARHQIFKIGIAVGSTDTTRADLVFRRVSS